MAGVEPVAAVSKTAGPTLSLSAIPIVWTPTRLLIPASLPLRWSTQRSELVDDFQIEEDN